MIITLWSSHIVLLLLILVPVVMAGSKKERQLEKMLLAGLVAKALAKGGGGEESHGGSPQYMPIPVPVHSGGGGGGGSGGGMQGSYSHHHHVHHKYVPIPVKHHTNFIIAHHKVHVPVKVPYPVYKTKVVHVPVEQTKLVPIIVNSPSGKGGNGYHRSRHNSGDHGYPNSSDSRKYYRNQRPRKSRYSSQGLKIKTYLPEELQNINHFSNFKNKSIPRRWIVVVKHKHRHFPVKATLK